MNTATLQHANGTRGQIFISDQAISAVVRGALSEVKGIHGLPPLNNEGGVLGVFAKGMREQSEFNVESGEDGALRVKLLLILEYGLKLDTLAREAMDTVRDRVHTLAGVEVAEIEVSVKGLYHAPPHSP